MSISTTKLHVLRLILQGVNNLVGLQRDMLNNAQSWSAMATAQNPPLATLQGYIRSAQAAYATRLAQIAAIQADATNWPLITAMWTQLGGTAADFTGIYTPLSTVTTQLGSADISSYAAIITGCNEIIAAVPAPVSIWPE